MENILYEKIDNIVRILANRPEAGNAQHDQMLEEMDEAFKRAEADDDVKVIIFGAKGRHFCGGHDIGPLSRPNLFEVKHKGLEEWMKRERHIYLDYCFNIRNLSKPTIAQIQGLCITGGVMVAAMCDIVYAADDALFSNPVARYTVAGDELMVEPWIFGARMAKEHMWTGDPITAQEAWRLGFVNKVVSREKLEEEVMNLARRIAITPEAAVRLIKKSINYAVDQMGFVNALEYHFLAHELSHYTEEAKKLFWEPLQEAFAQKTLKGFFERLNGPYQRKNNRPT